LGLSRSKAKNVPLGGDPKSVIRPSRFRAEGRTRGRREAGSGGRGGKFANGAVTGAFQYLASCRPSADSEYEQGRNSGRAGSSETRPELEKLANDPAISAAIDKDWDASGPRSRGEAKRLAGQLATLCQSICSFAADIWGDCDECLAYR